MNNSDIKASEVKAPLAVKIMAPISGLLIVLSLYLKITVEYSGTEAVFDFLELLGTVVPSILLITGVFIRNKPALFGAGLIVLAVPDMAFVGFLLRGEIHGLMFTGRLMHSFVLYILPLILRMISSHFLFFTAFHYLLHGRWITIVLKRFFSAVWVVLTLCYHVINDICIDSFITNPTYRILLAFVFILGLSSVVLLGVSVIQYSAGRTNPPERLNTR